jgi:hypothetical protein
MMSTTYDAHLLYGFRYEDVLKAKKVQEKVTRYNEETGKPYQKEILTGHQYFVFDREVTSEEFEQIADGFRENGGREPDNSYLDDYPDDAPQRYGRHYKEDRDVSYPTYFAVSVAQEPVSGSDFAAEVEKAKQEFRKLGWTGTPEPFYVAHLEFS